MASSGLFSPVRERRWIAIAADVTAFALTAIAVVITVILAAVVEPTVRGFYCDDRTIGFPVLPNTVPASVLFLACIVVPLSSMFLGVLYEQFVLRRESPPASSCCLRWLPRFVRYSMWMLIGLGITTSVTGILKLSSGELRPDFLDVCDPDFSTFNCTDSYNLPVYITNYTCRGNPLSVRDARQSWPSGHASLSAYSFTFTSLYIMSLPFFYPRSTIQLLIAGIPLLLALECGVSRITDNKHHPHDVIWGIGIGAFIAIVIVIYNLRFFAIGKLQEKPSNVTCCGRLPLAGKTDSEEKPSELP